MSFFFSSDDIDPDVLDRYLTGRTQPADARAVARWLAAAPGRQAALDALRAHLRQAPAFDVESMLARVDARIDRAEHGSGVTRRGELVEIGGGRRWGWAARMGGWRP